MNSVFSEVSNCLYTWADVAQIDKGLTPSSADAVLNARGLFRLPAPNPPEPGRYQFVVEVFPTKTSQGYLRNYEVRDMFTGPITDHLTGETLSVQQQKDQYDAQVAAQEQFELNAKARTYLAETDWYVIRYTETAVEVPADITTKRAEARASIK